MSHGSGDLSHGKVSLCYSKGPRPVASRSVGLRKVRSKCESSSVSGNSPAGLQSSLPETAFEISSIPQMLQHLFATWMRHFCVRQCIGGTDIRQNFK
jgi:hypothetical protein